MFVTYEYINGRWITYAWTIDRDQRILDFTGYNILSECAWIVPGTLDPTR